jgi:hypothetical protein
MADYLLIGSREYFDAGESRRLRELAEDLVSAGAAVTLFLPKRILAVVETAYRATLEEQDDPVIWLLHALVGSGAPVGLVLQGSAVNYAVEGRDAAGLSFGARAQTEPPRLGESIASLAGKGVPVLYVSEDAAERGILATELLDSVRPVKRGDLPRVFAEYDQIWNW